MRSPRRTSGIIRTLREAIGEIFAAGVLVQRLIGLRKSLKKRLFLSAERFLHLKSVMVVSGLIFFGVGTGEGGFSLGRRLP